MPKCLLLTHSLTSQAQQWCPQRPNLQQQVMLRVQQRLDSRERAALEDLSSSYHLSDEELVGFSAFPWQPLGGHNANGRFLEDELLVVDELCCVKDRLQNQIQTSKRLGWPTADPIEYPKMTIAKPPLHLHPRKIGDYLCRSIAY